MWPLVLERPAEDKNLVLEIRVDVKTIVDWVNGHAKQKKRGKVQLQLPRIYCGNDGAAELT